MPNNAPGWFDHKLTELRHYINTIIEDYDNGQLTLDQAKVRIAIMCKDSMTYTYDTAFTEGINAAELDDSVTEEVVEFEFDEDDEGDEEL